MTFLYIDPGAGSLLIQALIAGILAVPFVFRRAIRSAMVRLRGGLRQDGAATASPEVDEQG